MEIVESFAFRSIFFLSFLLRFTAVAISRRSMVLHVWGEGFPISFERNGGFTRLFNGISMSIDTFQVRLTSTTVRTILLNKRSYEGIQSFGYICLFLFLLRTLLATYEENLYL